MRGCSGARGIISAQRTTEKGRCLDRVQGQRSKQVFSAAQISETLEGLSFGRSTTLHEIPCETAGNIDQINIG